MPELTRRLIDAQHESWGIYYDRVRVGGISRRAGSPRDAPGWQWFCGFNCDNVKPGEDRHGVADSFDEARAAFETAWLDYLPLRTPEDFRWARRTRPVMAAAGMAGRRRLTAGRAVPASVVCLAESRDEMAIAKLEFHQGEALGVKQWFYLARDTDSGDVFVLHETSVQPGGLDSYHIELGVFLSGHGKLRKKLRHLIGSLVKE